MMGKIAIEPNLTPIKEYLTRQGYQVESVNFNTQPPVNLNGYDAFVVTGLNNDFLGVEKTETRAAVINAAGMSPEDVAKALKQQTGRAARDLRL
jgi:hypothetical protein